MNTDTNYTDIFFSNIPNDEDTLKNNVKEYPFSSVARFLLLYHYKKNNNVAFENFSKQTGIYINNPFWLQYQLSKINDGAFSNEDSSQSEIQNKNVEENFPVETEESDLPAEEQIIQIPVSENEAFNETEIKNNSYQEEKQNKNIEENIPVAADQQILPILVSENELINETEIKNNSYQEEKQNENIEENIPRAADQQIMPIPVSENKTKEETGMFRGFETELKRLGNNEEDLILFEPLHTVDYFASQGIKISEEALENDHLGKQVKSFTAWLKSMKKLHPGQLPEQNEVIEKIIQANAEVSNQNANVLTEAMAEVLIKQNKKEKAIEMYQKLSLINPSKSAYFAAKIENLKLI
ncbi:MAG: hypothetical protein ABI185_10910 [Ginsengibacter sp.]